MTDDQAELEVEQRFATVPEWVLRASLPDRAVRLYAVLQRFGNASGHRMPGFAELRDWLHCSDESVHRAITALEGYGALCVTRHPKPVRGQQGYRRPPNRYLLRTSDPSVGHVLPSPAGTRTGAARGTRSLAGTGTRNSAGRVPAPQRVDREVQEQEPPPTPSTTVDVTAVEAVRTLGDLAELAGELSVERRLAGLPYRLWTARNVERAAHAALANGYPAGLFAGALRHVALDRETRSPLRVAAAGPWWDAVDLDRHRRGRSSSAARRRAAIAACTRCDSEGWLDVDGPAVRCDHRTEATA